MNRPYGYLRKNSHFQILFGESRTISFRVLQSIDIAEQLRMFSRYFENHLLTTEAGVEEFAKFIVRHDWVVDVTDEDRPEEYSLILDLNTDPSQVRYLLNYDFDNLEPAEQYTTVYCIPQYRRLSNNAVTFAALLLNAFYPDQRITEARIAKLKPSIEELMEAKFFFDAPMIDKYYDIDALLERHNNKQRMEYEAYLITRTLDPRMAAWFFQRHYPTFQALAKQIDKIGRGKALKAFYSVP